MRRLCVLILLAALVVGGSSGLFAQAPTGSISGRTTDAGGQAIANMRVQLLLGGNIVAMVRSGPQGEFTFPGLAPGSYTVRAQGTCRSVDQAVSVADGQAVANVTVPSSAQNCFAGLGPYGWWTVAGIGAIVATTAIIATAS